MRVEGLEPPRLAPPAPKAGVSTSSTTPARRIPDKQPAPPRPARRRIVWSRPAMAAQDAVIEHPNRRKAASKLTKALVVLLLLASAGLVAIVTIGGWDALQGAKAVQVGYVVLYVGMAFLVARWNRGVLPVAAALAIIMLIFAAIAGPAWFERDKEGFTDPALDPSLLGLLAGDRVVRPPLVEQGADRALGLDVGCADEVGRCALRLEALRAAGRLVALDEHRRRRTGGLDRDGEQVVAHSGGRWSAHVRAF